MSERDPIWTEGSILADISDFSLLTSEEKETLLKFRGLYAKYMENEAIYRRFSRSEDEYDKALRMKALNDNLSMSSELYKLLGTSEIEHILELHSLGAFSGKKEVPAVETTTKTQKNVFCWKCGARLMDDGDFCVKCGANATTFDEGVNRTAAPAKSKPRFKLDADKRNKIIKISIIAAVAVVILILIISSAVNSARNAELRNFATETMNEDYTNVYADVVSIEPEYFVYTSYSGSSYMISEVVCRCKTVEGKSIWVTIDRGDYPGGGWDEDDFESKSYYKFNPMRLTGRVTTSGDVIEKLANSIGDVFVLDVKELQE